MMITLIAFGISGAISHLSVRILIPDHMRDSYLDGSVSSIGRLVITPSSGSTVFSSIRHGHAVGPISKLSLRRATSAVSSMPIGPGDFSSPAIRASSS